MQYVNYEYYQAQYQGTVLDEGTFPRYCRMVCHLADVLTAHRLDNALVTDPMRDALCAAAECWQEQQLRGDVKSETNDGYAVTFGNAPQHTPLQILYAALHDSGLLYRGFAPC